MEMTNVQIELETLEYRICGTLTIPAVQRLSDALNGDERCFLALSRVTRWSKSDGNRTSHAFLAIARQHVICVTEPDSADVRPDQGHLLSDRI